MSISPISGSIQQQQPVVADAGTTSQTTTTNQPTTPKQTAEPAAAETQSQHYTVKLSGAALAKSLKLAGQNPSQIALKMGLNIKTVDGYLGISATTAAPSASTVAPAAKQAAASPLEESTESAAAKAAETAQGKK